MLLDVQVAGDVKSLKLAILANGVNFLPAVAQEQTATGKDTLEYKKAVKYADFCTRLFARIPLIVILNDMLSALAVGNRVAELVWKLETSGPDKGKMVLDRMKPKQRSHVAFVVDNTGNTVGILAAMGWHGNYGAGWQGNLIDPANTPGFLPPGKFAVLSYAPENADPRGTSILRPAYNPWWIKQQIWADFLRHLAQVGGGVLWGTTAEGAQASVPLDSYGAPIPGAPMVTAEQAMNATLLNVRSGACASFPYGAEVNLLAAPNVADTFDNAINTTNQEISKAILSQTLATNEGLHQSRAATGSHKDIFDLLVQFGELTVTLMLKAICVDALRWNFGDEAAELCPKVLMSAAEEADLASLATAVASLKTSGYLSPSQYAALDQLLGIPIRTPEETEQLKQNAIVPEVEPGTDPTKDPANDPDKDDTNDE